MIYLANSNKIYLANSNKGPLLGSAATLNLRFSAAIEPIFDRLDIFSDAINLKNTLVPLFFSLPAP